jgi:type VI secretion system secreted protein VgrG
LAQDASSPDACGNAPGSQRSGTWTRLAWPGAGANWGSALVPRLGTEVSVQFVEAILHHTKFAVGREHP